MVVTNRIGFECDLHQAQTDFVYSKEAYTCFMGGYGSGKTIALCYRSLSFAAINPGLRGAIIAPDFPRMKRDVLPNLFAILSNAGVPYTYHKTDREIVIYPGRWRSIISLVSMDNPERLKGATLAWVTGDEAALWPQTMPGIPGTTWEVIVSRMRETRGTRQIALVSTPEGEENWLSELFVYGPDDASKRADWERDHWLIRAATYENHHLPASYIEAMRKSFDAIQFREKILGIPSAKSGGRAYHAFDRRVHVRPVTFIRGLPLRVAVDFNVNPMTGVLWQKVGDTAHAIGEIVIPDSNTFELSKAIKKAAKVWRIAPEDVMIYPDASGANRSSKGVSDIDILKKEGLRKIRIAKKNPPQRDRVNVTNGMFAHGRIFIHPDCAYLTRDCTKVKTRPGTGELDKRDPELTHATDAFGYGLYMEFPIRKPKLGVIALKQ